MFKPGIKLTTDALLLAAMFSKASVTVLQQNVIVDPGGPIEAVKKSTIQINGSEYSKTICEFCIS